MTSVFFNIKLQIILNCTKREVQKQMEKQNPLKVVMMVLMQMLRDADKLPLTSLCLSGFVKENEIEVCGDRSMTYFTQMWAMQQISEESTSRPTKVVFKEIIKDINFSFGFYCRKKSCCHLLDTSTIRVQEIRRPMGFSHFLLLFVMYIFNVVWVLCVDLQLVKIYTSKMILFEKLLK